MAIEAPVRVGIIGLGRAGWGMHRPEMQQHGGFRVVAGYDAAKERVELLEKTDGARGYHSVDDLLADPNVDLVVVATRSDTHAEMVIRALRAGKHVIAEKPFALNVQEADAITKVAATAKGQCLVRQNRRFDPDFMQIKQLVDDGVLGELHMVRLYRHNYHRRADWQTLKAYGGGLLNNWGPHIIDHALQFIQIPVVSLFSDLRIIAAAGDAEDHLKIVMRGTRGVVADIEISGGVALPLPVYHLVGGQGSLTCDGSTIHVKWYDRAKMPELHADPSNPPLESGFSNEEPVPWQEETIPVQPRQTDFYSEVYRTLVEGAEFPITVEHARAVVEVTELAREGTGF